MKHLYELGAAATIGTCILRGEDFCLFIIGFDARHPLNRAARQFEKARGSVLLALPTYAVWASHLGIMATVVGVARLRGYQVFSTSDASSMTFQRPKPAAT